MIDHPDEHDEAPIPITSARSAAWSGGETNDPLSRILTAALDLARMERDGIPLDDGEALALDACDQISGVRDIIADEHGDPAPHNFLPGLYDF